MPFGPGYLSLDDREAAIELIHAGIDDRDGSALDHLRRGVVSDRLTGDSGYETLLRELSHLEIPTGTL